MWDSCLVEGVPTIKCFEVLFALLLRSLSGLVFVILLAMFVMGSISWLTAGDNPEKLKKAKATFFSALTGLIIIAVSYLVLVILGDFLGLEGLTQFKIVTD
ncbi:hypothetical protein A2313_03425 [Candidatus Roizmanbacteria bacterium RIFOXYB2_FULL_41_10]|uniref:Uncharacterized protein n=1 Tax=Candidatus Roizmanbacteria bacterium RIFOXYA1_FULL_41_12 TaxID=1802082 RepID=A0A1F7KGP6_9BACT|nr:MAG: hypothetical protein A2262_01960 [Candidatus Roizmanbacteria bacterium RIFOXYA2_FULL_41_8]OGK67046.1 MAG: hypothetical protein A2209_03260 [Candidatus Roizmanbacteria bacterium RIFOXYA1_FULL_41_12]OGK71660.1 MAG: hypothetical protein A2403_04335 [Candidatus Roizmanbacteria bacterium RIFOXYC1_FULL_41_16]OGK72134.1 MAG: hypothetical protein A2313_03425 [Candidatus Roizmanbacteria bacterium RIFOXYB2_FULL_41_10]OGK75046.1 MAG: hypothetical protein A2575_03940 [Candidatus Roizmanbacteria bac